MDPQDVTSSAATTNSTGSTTSFNNSSSAIETVSKVGNLNSDDVQETGTDGSSPVISRRNGKISSSVVAGEDEDEGFVSGEEEFEMAPENPIDYKGDNSDAGPVVASSELSTPNDVVDDDVENINKDGVLEGRKAVVGGGDEGKVGYESVVAGELSGDSIRSNVADDSKEPQVVEPPQKPEVPNSVGDSDVNSSENGVEIQGGTFEGSGDSEKGSEVPESVGEGQAVDSAPEVAKAVESLGDSAYLNNGTSEIKEEEPIQEDGLKHAAEGDSVVVGETDAKDEHSEIPGHEDLPTLNTGDARTEIVEEEERKPTEEDCLKLASKGDSVVEAINVNVTEPGVAVVGETAAEDEHAKLPGDENGTALNIGDTNSEIGGEEGAKSVEENGPKVTLEADSVVEAIKVDLVAPGVAVVGDRVDASSIAKGPQKVDETEISDGFVGTQDDGLEDSECAEPRSIEDAAEVSQGNDEPKTHLGEEAELEGSISDGENDEMIFGSSEAAKQFVEELERGSGGDSLLSGHSSHDHGQRIDGQVATDSEDEVDTDEEGEGKELFDSAALAALLKAATGADSDGNSITITSQDGSRLFSVERPAGLGSSLRSLRPTPQPRRPNIFSPSTLSPGGDPDSNVTDEEKKKLEKLQQIRVKFFRLVHRLGLSPDESVAAQVLYRLSIVAGRQSGQLFNADTAKMTAMQLEEEKKDDLDFSLNILVLGKCGVGKSATINSVFGEEKAQIDAFQPGTSSVKEITGFVDGVKIRVFDTPGLKSSVMEQSFNRSVLSMVKKFTKKNPPDIILYVDRLDAQTRDLNDLPLLRTITSSLGPSIWRNAIVTLTHAASAPPDGPSGSPLSYEVFVTQRSHVVQQSIGQAVGDLRMMTPSMMNPVSLVENHPSCRKNREGQKVLPNGQSWKPQLLLLCYSMKILSEASSLSKPQDPFDHRKLFGFRGRSPPLPYMLSSMLQSRQHPKLPSEQGVDSVDSDVDLDDLSDVENDEEDEYDQLPPFRPLRKAQITKLSKEQRRAYFEEFDYRVKLLQKKQWKEELRRIRMMKTKGKDAAVEYGLAEEDADSGAAAPVAVPLPDMVLPPSFDSDNPGYRYRFLEPTSQLLARPVLDTHGWDHDCGYDGVNVEHGLAIANHFPAAVTVQITKDKKDFSISLDSSISTKHGENGSSMAGFDIQSIGKQLAYIVRGETKFKNLKKNKTSGGISVTFLGENVVPGLKLEDQITLGKQYVLVGSAGAVRSQNDTALGANFELQRRENDFPIGQVQSTFSMSVVRWRGDTALGFNGLTQVSLGRNSKVAVRAGINNKMSGQITVRTSSSDQLSLALTALIPTAISIYRKLWPGVADKYSMY